MKVVIINGSPRANGNSDLLCNEFIRGAKENGHETEKISLRDYNLNPCKACYACFKTGKCIQKDDMAEILNKVKKVDVLLLASNEQGASDPCSLCSFLRFGYCLPLYN